MLKGFAMFFPLFVVCAGVVSGSGAALEQGRAGTAGGKCWRLHDLETA